MGINRTKKSINASWKTYQSNFSKYIKVEGAILATLIISLTLELENSYPKKKRDAYMIYLRNEIESILNLMKILMIIWTMMDLNTLLKMKASRIITWMIGLVGIESSKKLLHHYFLSCQMSS